LEISSTAKERQIDDLHNQTTRLKKIESNMLMLQSKTHDGGRSSSLPDEKCIVQMDHATLGSKRFFANFWVVYNVFCLMYDVTISKESWFDPLKEDCTILLVCNKDLDLVLLLGAVL
jgi:hypothetical protein